MGEVRRVGPPGAALLVAAALAGCRAPEPPPRGVPAMTPQLAADLAVVRRGRILFSHHSVGANLLEGIARLDREAGGGAVAIAPLDAAPAEGGALVHGSGGRNGDPRGKIDFFAELVGREPRLLPQVALMKLCYVDFEPGTDVDGLFAHYRDTIARLAREHPGIRFLHVTVPLMVRPTDPKSTVRRLLGLEVWDDAANARRDAYNRRLAEAFPGAVFDLARVESTGPDGRQATFEHEGKTHPSLYPGYTEDGGHLNEAGQRVAAAAALRFLAGALEATPRGR